jgi:hypothetical protein
MAKELPYFQFEPAEYLTKDISFCTISAQGLFINICCFYWQRKCDLTKEQFLRRFNYENEFNELINEGVIDMEEGKIIIKFLDAQYFNATNKSLINSSNGSKGGRPKKPKENQIESQIKSEIKPKENQIESELKGIREDNIILKEIKINNIEERKLKFADTLKPFVEIYGRNLLNDFYHYWTEPNKSNTKLNFELQKTWSVERRLNSWAKNEKNFNKKTNANETRTTSQNNAVEKFKQRLVSSIDK